MSDYFNFSSFGTTPFIHSRLGFFFSLIFLFVGLFSIFYALGQREKRERKVIWWILIMTLCGMGVAFGNNLLYLFIFWELSTVAVWQLIAFYRDKESLEAAELAFLVNFAASTLMLVGIGLVYLANGNFDLSLFVGKNMGLLPGILILSGILAKSAIFPFYLWLPSAYQKSPISAIASLAGIGESIGLLVFLKVFVLTFRLPSDFYTYGAGLGVASSILAGGIALRVKGIRAILAFSTISQLAFILFGFSLLTFYGVMGGILHILAHSLAKPGLFFLTGIWEEENDRNGNRREALPFSFLTLSLIGLPPFLGFFSKLGIILGGVERHFLFGVFGVVSALFTLLYFLRLYQMIFPGDPAVFGRNKETKGGLWAISLLFAFLSLILGLGFLFLVNYLRPEVKI
ncbi:MAG: proton-conducting transporter membrane subunit [candidate division WOR-3 bacterium]